jgi:hypothetical protein
MLYWRLSYDGQNCKPTAQYSTAKHKYIDIIGRSQAAVRDAYLALEKEANKVGLKINESKTKYTIAAGTDRLIRDVRHSVVFGDKTFEVVKEFVYLGSLVTPNNDVSLEIQGRISRDCKHLQSRHLSRSTKKPSTRP